MALPLYQQLNTGGSLPPAQVNGAVPAQPQPLFQQFMQPTAAPFTDALSGSQTVQQGLEAFLNPNSDYIRNARQRGIEYANTRGGINSSIAAGAAERSALEAAAPLAEQAIAIDQNRENALTAQWMANQNFARDLQGQLTMMPLNSSFNMLETLNQYALTDPELYTPAVMSGFTNFFNKNMNDMMSRYFGGSNAPATTA